MMSLLASRVQVSGASGEGERQIHSLRDYAQAVFNFTWQRQGIFAASAILTAYFFDPLYALVFYSLAMLSEVSDLLIARATKRLEDDDVAGMRRSHLLFVVNTVFSAGIISGYVVFVAFLQGPGEVFTPLFFLFAAALFAAMYNHQIFWALMIRLAMYGTAFLIVTVKDLIIYRPQLSSELWLHFFTVVFVMYFLIDCALVFMRLYKRNLMQLEELKAEHERTKAALEIKSQFVSIVSHELRTPLTSVKGSLELINSEKLSPIPKEIAPLLEMAAKNSRRLAHLIDDLLDLQKIEAGEMTFKRELVNIQALISEAIASNEGLAKKFNVRLLHDKSDVAPLFVMADESRLMQVLSNMISNAAKFSFDGGDVLIGSTMHEDKVRIYVKDFGVGIPEGSKEKVFDRFSQLDSSDQRRVGGTGLGMNISREIVESFSGTIDYDSRPGQGTTFFMDLPSIQAKDARELGGEFKPRAAAG